MRGCNPTPTKHDLVRFRKLQDFGCIACRLEGHFHEPCDIHHIKQGSHQDTIGLCPWHHRGDTIEGCSATLMRTLRGPSLRGHKRAFILAYGTEAQLLAQTNKAIEAA